MLSVKLVGYSILFVSSCGALDLSFPPDFKFGAASSSYQVEGAWNVSDKSISVWDKYVHDSPHAISDGSNGDVACDSYNLWQRDIEMAEELGLHFYRFSISWPRLLPNGFTNYISKDGQEYYNNLINGLLSKGIEPVVTIYHWDLPQKLQDLGGWLNPLMTDWFADYAKVVFSLYGDRVKTWITLNEPIAICDAVYSVGLLAPAVHVPDVGTYICNKNTMIAHAKAWRIYDKEFRALYNGEVSLANQVLWYDPLTPDDEDIAEAAREYMGGRYSHPIYSKEGGWPPVIEKMVAEASKKRGYKKSNLPEFSKEEIELVRGTFDFYALNHYTSRLARHAEPGEELHLLGDAPDINGKFLVNPEWTRTASDWFFVNPEGLRRLLVWLKKQYGDIKILITENGYASGAGLEDVERINYYRDYLEQVLVAIKEDGVNVVGYTAWTLMDNFEWMHGYQSKFGLYEVDFDSPMRTRTPRASAIYYKNIIKAHSLIDPNSMSKDEL
ncbi:hypothetical protein K1T71_012872 [Dendrolimus kikuchii]|uniref:Uncharacterized protein n=1 Tax=Dendrolimus kikuchii TaxID=765133 RepID=A0ACC1CIN7_9NEOP|nr:hypothetical protein K1T71_012872 [Dendrolimus kikuchii]